MVKGALNPYCLASLDLAQLETFLEKLQDWVDGGKMLSNGFSIVIERREAIAPQHLAKKPSATAASICSLLQFHAPRRKRDAGLIADKRYMQLAGWLLARKVACGTEACIAC